ncbi:pentulose/hexulose kinase [Saccharomonospora marina XMU15]|uniref:Pentulose/hexulose kinase n=1 Tax=Saccharomonospora marina XMU15 TaxID=882083 RepID=H5WZG1_9PSEU|nr:FGGY-family carbohydrate kinase [Saccharomonospora marina]EHR49623.1 pentulose/hexulose kinase [Saccharomonospora marina XMU15]
MYLGIDIGTSVTKAALFGEGGQVLAFASHPTRLESPRRGWFEQRPDDVLDSVATVTRDVVARAGRAPRLLGLTGQGDGVWLAGEDGRPVRPAVSWLDSRAAGVLRRWMHSGVVEQAFRRTGNTMFPGAAAPVLAWLDEHEPASLDRAATAGYCKDLVMQRLTGVRATDVSDASLPFLDPVSRQYRADVLAMCGLSHRLDLLAPVARPSVTGALTPEAAALLGLGEGTPVAAGPFDLPACALGSGVTRPGEGHLIVGTTLACQVLVDSVDTAGEPAGMTLSTGTGDRWLRAMPAMVGTAALDWVLGLVGETHDALDGMLDACPPGAGGVTCLPYFSPSGERAPFVDPSATAAFDGLSLQTSGADLVRATCEAVAFAARHCFDAAGLDGDVAMCGGGTRSSRWLRMFADVLARPVRLAPQPETGARGAALAAARAFGDELDEAVWTAPMAVIEPDPDNAARYEDGYRDYRARVDAARGSWKEQW